MPKIPVFLYAEDPICQAGLAFQLGRADEIELVRECDIDAAAVAVVFVDELDEESALVVQAVQRSNGPRVVLVVTEIDADGVALAAECGITGLVRRREATADRLANVVVATAAGNGFIPADLLGGLLRRIQTSQLSGEPLRGGEHSPKLTDREATVLRMISDGCATREIARTMAYSERTVKNVIQDIMLRFGAKNRPHAVAFAVRNGLL